MTDDVTMSVACSNCGYTFPDPATATGHGDERQPCPDCGQRGRKAFVQATATVVGHASLAGVAYRESKSKWFAKFVSGRRSWFRRDGRWHLIDRVLSKRENKYSEVVRDEATGQVVHECHEPLTDHQGHGSAKRQPDQDGGP